MIRAWAEEHGIAISDRGRIPASVTRQYDAVKAGRFIYLAGYSFGAVAAGPGIDAGVRSTARAG